MMLFIAISFLLFCVSISSSPAADVATCEGSHPEHYSTPEQYRKPYDEMCLAILKYVTDNEELLDKLKKDSARQCNFFNRGIHIRLSNLNQANKTAVDYEKRKAEIIKALEAHPEVEELMCERLHLDDRNDFLKHSYGIHLKPIFKIIRVIIPTYENMNGMWLLVLNQKLFTDVKSMDQFAHQLANEHSFRFIGKFESEEFIGHYRLAINNKIVCSSAELHLRQVELIGNLSSHPAVRELAHERRKFRDNYTDFRLYEVYDCFEIMNREELLKMLAKMKNGTHVLWLFVLDWKYKTGRRVQDSEFVRRLAMKHGFHFIGESNCCSENDYMLEIDMSDSGGNLSAFADGQLKLIETFRSQPAVEWLGREHEVIRTNYEQLKANYENISLEELQTDYAQLHARVIESQNDPLTYIDEICEISSTSLMESPSLCGEQSVMCTSLPPFRHYPIGLNSTRSNFYVAK